MACNDEYCEINDEDGLAYRPRMPTRDYRGIEMTKEELMLQIHEELNQALDDALEEHHRKRDPIVQKYQRNKAILVAKYADKVAVLKKKHAEDKDNLSKKYRLEMGP